MTTARASTRVLVVALGLGLVSSAQADAAKPAKKRYLVAVGDSYSIGFQPLAPGQGAATRDGYAEELVRLARKRGHRLRLVNFACGRETTATLLQRTQPCAQPAIGGPDYAGTTQIAAAEAFLRANRQRIGLVTVSVGGNDVTACATAVEPVPCVAAAVESIRANVGEIVTRLRAAAGSRARIIGLTYPNVILGKWVGADADQNLARLSVAAFRDLINPALRAAYLRERGRLIDVTRATGGYGSLDRLTSLAPHGAVPVPVARICRLTYYCEMRDIHARAPGYRLIARLIARTLPRRHVH